MPLTNVTLEGTPESRELVPDEQAMLNEERQTELKRLVAEQRADERADRRNPRPKQPDRLS